MVYMLIKSKFSVQKHFYYPCNGGHIQLIISHLNTFTVVLIFLYIYLNYTKHFLWYEV